MVSASAFLILRKFVGVFSLYLCLTLDAPPLRRLRASLRQHLGQQFLSQSFVGCRFCAGFHQFLLLLADLICNRYFSGNSSIKFATLCRSAAVSSACSGSSSITTAPAALVSALRTSLCFRPHASRNFFSKSPISAPGHVLLDCTQALLLRVCFLESMLQL